MLVPAMKRVVQHGLDVAIAFAVIFFLYGLVKVIVGLSSGEERLRAVATTIVVAVVLASLLWVASAMRPKS